MYLGNLLGAQLDPVIVVAILEFLLAAYDVAFVFSTKNKILKVLHVIIAIAWVLFGVLNLGLIKLAI